MKASQSSATADMCAVARAHHFLFDPDPVFSDPFGAILTSDRWRRILDNPILRRLVIEGLLRPTRPSVGSLVGRARYLEDEIELAIDRGVTQYVIVGAGMDSFAIRRRDLLDRVRTFELDHPNTQRVKRARLAQFHPLPDRVSYVPIDFAKESIASALRESVFDPTQKTLFSWMGVTYYLRDSTVYDALATMGATAHAGCEIIFDYQTRADASRSHDDLQRKFMRALTRSVGEPQITAFDDDRLREELATRGLETVDVVTGDRMRALYFSGRSDGLRPHRRVRVAHVRSASLQRARDGASRLVDRSAGRDGVCSLL